jgi:hypothetical protein
VDGEEEVVVVATDARLELTLWPVTGYTGILLID